MDPITANDGDPKAGLSTTARTALYVAVALILAAGAWMSYFLAT